MLLSRVFAQLPTILQAPQQHHPQHPPTPEAAALARLGGFFVGLRRGGRRGWLVVSDGGVWDVDVELWVVDVPIGVAFLRPLT